MVKEKKLYTNSMAFAGGSPKCVEALQNAKDF